MIRSCGCRHSSELHTIQCHFKFLYIYIPTLYFVDGLIILWAPIRNLVMDHSFKQLPSSSIPCFGNSFSDTATNQHDMATSITGSICMLFGELKNFQVLWFDQTVTIEDVNQVWLRALLQEYVVFCIFYGTWTTSNTCTLTRRRGSSYATLHVLFHFHSPYVVSFFFRFSLFLISRNFGWGQFELF